MCDNAALGTFSCCCACRRRTANGYSSAPQDRSFPDQRQETTGAHTSGWEAWPEGGRESRAVQRRADHALTMQQANCTAERFASPLASCWCCGRDEHGRTVGLQQVPARATNHSRHLVQRTPTINGKRLRTFMPNCHHVFRACRVARRTAVPREGHYTESRPSPR